MGLIFKRTLPPYKDTLLEHKHRKEEFIQKQWLDKKIISIDNGFETDSLNNSLKVGKIVGFKRITKAKDLVPLVKYEEEKEVHISLSTIIQYSDSLLQILQKLDAKERWQLVMSICHRLYI